MAFNETFKRNHPNAKKLTATMREGTFTLFIVNSEDEIAMGPFRRHDKLTPKEVQELLGTIAVHLLAQGVDLIVMGSMPLWLVPEVDSVFKEHGLCIFYTYYMEV